MKFLYLAVCLFPLALSAHPIDTVRIEEVVIAENGIQTPVSKLNRNVYTIEKEIIQKLPGKTLLEILQYANGVDLQQRGPFGTQADISIDGGSFEQTVVLLNGITIMDAQTAHNMLNLPLPIALVERVEVIRGPAARIYGINSLTGAVNIITKQAEANALFLDTYAGSSFQKDTAGHGNLFYAGGVQLSGMLAKDRHQHVLGASYDRSNGYRYNTQFENIKVYYQGSVQLAANHELKGSFGYVNNDFGAHAFYAAPGDKEATEKVQTTLASLQSKHKWGHRWSLMPQVSYRYNFDDYLYLGPKNPSVGRSKHYSNSALASVTASYEAPRAIWSLGASYRSEQIHSTSIGDRNRDNWGMHIQYKQAFFADRLLIHAGTYLNYHSDYKWQVYPGIDWSYSFSKHFKFIGNVGTSQRIPSFTDLYLNQRPGNIGNPDVKPESALQGELGFHVGKGRVSMRSYVFSRVVSSFIDWTRTSTAEPWQSFNVGDLHTKGWNTHVNWTILERNSIRLQATTMYSYLHTQVPEMDAATMSKYQLSALRHQLTNMLWLDWKTWSISSVTRYNHRMNRTHNWIQDVRLQYKATPITIYVDAQNLLNAQYVEIGAVPLPSRWVRVGVQWQLK